MTSVKSFSLDVLLCEELITKPVGFLQVNLIVARWET